MVSPHTSIAVGNQQLCPHSSMPFCREGNEALNSRSGNRWINSIPACNFMLIDILVFSHLGLTGYSLAANWAALGICYNTGQDCTAGSRVYVQESIYDKFIELLTATVKTTVVGDGFDDQTTCGPVVRSLISWGTSLTLLD